MNIEDLVNKYGSKLNNGELEVDATELMVTCLIQEIKYLMMNLNIKIQYKC